MSLFRLQINWRAVGHGGLSGNRPEVFNWRGRKRGGGGRWRSRGQEGEDATAVLVRGVRDFSGDRVLYFEVLGGTVCSTKSPQSFVYYCHVCSLCFHGLILNAWVKSFGPGETNSRGIGIGWLCALSGRLSTGIDATDIRNIPLNPVDTMILEECVFMILWVTSHSELAYMEQAASVQYVLFKPGNDLELCASR